MDDQQLVASQDESDQLEEVARFIGPDEEHFRWVGVGIEVGDHDDMVVRMLDAVDRDAVLERRPMAEHND